VVRVSKKGVSFDSLSPPLQGGNIMKYLKRLGLAVIVATALGAVCGVGSASATVLCKTNLTTGCAAAGWSYPAGTELVATLEGTATWTGGITVTCTEERIKGSTSNAGGATETVSGNTSEVVITIPSCVNCSTMTVTNGFLEIHHIAGTGNGTLTASGFTTHFVCFGITCNYVTGNNNDIGTLTGSGTTGSTATMDINMITTLDSGSSFLCGSSNALWEGSYKVTTPDSL
jgi:hypothetical protein